MIKRIFTVIFDSTETDTNIITHYIINIKGVKSVTWK